MFVLLIKEKKAGFQQIKAGIGKIITAVDPENRESMLTRKPCQSSSSFIVRVNSAFIPMNSNVMNTKRINAPIDQITSILPFSHIIPIHILLIQWNSGPWPPQWLSQCG